MEKWINKNLKWITILFIFLFFIKSFQSCNRNMSLSILEKNLTEECDSILSLKNEIISQNKLEIDSLNEEILTRDFIIKDLTNELKIAGVKVDQAERRADAIQRTAEKIRSNTTIEVRGVERDTIKKEK